MVQIMLVLWLVLLTLLLMVVGVKPKRSQLSLYELHRRGSLGDMEARQSHQREELISYVISLQNVLIALGLVCLAILGLIIFGWTLDLLIMAAIITFYQKASRLNTVFLHYTQQLYDRYEAHLLGVIERHIKIFKLISSQPVSAGQSVHLGSREELDHIIDNAGNVLSQNDKKLLAGALKFEKRAVREVMTQRDDIAFIHKNELLGPLVLNELHRAGHSRVPVTGGDLDHIIGILEVKDMLNLDKKRSLTAEKAMDSQVFYVSQDQSLGQVLEVFLKSHQHLLIVKNEAKATVGLISLRDVVEALLGRRLASRPDQTINSQPTSE